MAGPKPAVLPLHHGGIAEVGSLAGVWLTLKRTFSVLLRFAQLPARGGVQSVFCVWRKGGQTPIAASGP